MKETNIYQALSRMALDYLDVDFHIETLLKYPEGVYFKPTNKENEDFNICHCLSQMNLIETKRVPVWGDNYFRGMTIWFRYKKDLKY